MIDVKRATGTGKSGSGRFTVSYAMVFVTSVAETVGRSSADLWLGVWKQGNGTAWQRAADRRYGRADNYGHDDFVGYTIDELLRPLQATSHLIGMRYLKPFAVMGASSISDENLQKAAEEYEQYLQKT